ncbi:hypothetical protein [Caballeronia sp. dw_276]|uniref:hypothetical protein n=1 Tax=Caballeronia sp. dw_276 TaxID=2719795 RepID=UPI001BD37BB5|nr:hypothetical protein [Caballeronia sp. dw_276]
MSGWLNDQEQKAHDAAELRKALEIIERRKARESTTHASSDGLTMSVKFDNSGREIRTFKGSKAWMNPWRNEGVQIHRFVTHHAGSDISGVEYVRQGSARYDALMRGTK